MNTGIPPAGAHEHWSERLSPYLDGELESAERARLEAHVAECAACAVALAELREVMARARTLEDRPPATDLWPAIEARLTPRAAPAPRRGVIIQGPAWWGRRFDLGLPQLAAAAVLLVTLSAAAVWLLLRGPVPPGSAPPPAGPVASRRVSPAPSPAPAEPAPARRAGSAGDRATPGATFASLPVNLDDPRYDAAVAELEQVLAEGRGKLDPRTLAVVEQNLNIIDRAIDDARRAIEADPRNVWLRSHLAANKKRKVDLLRSAALLANAS